MPVHPGLADLFGYPLMSALAERRTRRIARGTSVSAADLSHVSTNEPAPLSALEEAVLVVLDRADRPRDARRSVEAPRRQQRARLAVPQRDRPHGEQSGQRPRHARSSSSTITASGCSRHRAERRR